MNRVLIILTASIDIAAVIFAPILDIHFHNDAAFQIAYGIAAVATFMLLMPIALDSSQPRFQFRELIASSFIITYLLLVTSAAFFHKNLPEGNLTGTLVSNFTTLTGVVVGAYFGASAIEKFAGPRGKAEESQVRNDSEREDGTRESRHGEGDN